MAARVRATESAPCEGAASPNIEIARQSVGSGAIGRNGRPRRATARPNAKKGAAKRRPFFIAPVERLGAGLLTLIGRVLVEYRPFAVLELNDETGQLGVAIRIKANRTEHADVVRLAKLVANGNALSRQIGHATGGTGFLDDLGEEIDDLVGLGIDMVRKCRFDADLLVCRIELLGKCPSLVVQIPPESGGEDGAVSFRADHVDDLGIRKELGANHPTLMHAIEFLK